MIINDKELCPVCGEEIETGEDTKICRNAESCHLKCYHKTMRSAERIGESKIRSLVREILLKEWFPAKEDLIYFEDLAKKQVRMFDDAADYGIYSTEQLKNEIRSRLQELMKIYGGKTSKWSTGSSIKIFIPIENDGGYLSGEILEVSYNILPRSKIFFSIDISRKMLSKGEAVSLYRAKL